MKKTIPINVTPGGLCYGIKASYFKNASLVTLTGGGISVGITATFESYGYWVLYETSDNGDTDKAEE